MTGLTLSRAFEHLGQMREHLTALQSLAADIEDPELSMAIRGAMTANTAAMKRTNELLQATKTTDALDEDLDSHHVEGARGG